MAEIQARRAVSAAKVSCRPAFERELDVVFGRLAPPAASEDFDAHARRRPRSSPTSTPTSRSSRRSPAGRRSRRSCARPCSSTASTSPTRSRLRRRPSRAPSGCSARRVDVLEDAVPGTSPRVRREHRPRPSAATASEWADALAGRLPQRPRAGAGRGVRRRRPRRASSSTAASTRTASSRAARSPTTPRPGLEVREDEVLDHLRLVPPDGVGGIVLVGCVDRLGLGQQLALLDAAAHVLAAGGTLAVVTGCARPTALPTEMIAADLAPGRPLHPATWQHLLDRQRLRRRGGAGSPTQGPSFEPVPGDDEAAAALNRNFERLDTLVTAPGAGARRREACSSLTAVHQFVPSFAARDAIGAHTLQVQQVLRELGLRSDIYVAAPTSTGRADVAPVPAVRRARRRRPGHLAAVPGVDRQPDRPGSSRSGPSRSSSTTTTSRRRSSSSRGSRT